MTHSDFIARFCSNLGLHEKVQLKVQEIADKSYKLGIVQNNTPPTIAAGCIFFVSTIYSLNLSKKLISQQCGTSQVTITTTYNNLININIWLILTMLFWFDATVTLIRRFINREKLSQAHKKHMYQRAIQSGFSHRKVLLIGLSINFVLFILGYIIHKEYSSYLIGYIISLILLFLILKYIDGRISFSSKDSTT